MIILGNLYYLVGKHYNEVIVVLVGWLVWGFVFCSVVVVCLFVFFFQSIYTFFFFSFNFIIVLQVCFTTVYSSKMMYSLSSSRVFCFCFLNKTNSSSYLIQANGQYRSCVGSYHLCFCERTGNFYLHKKKTDSKWHWYSTQSCL